MRTTAAAPQHSRVRPYFCALGDGSPSVDGTNDAGTPREHSPTDEQALSRLYFARAGAASGASVVHLVEGVVDIQSASGRSVR